MEDTRRLRGAGQGDQVEEGAAGVRRFAAIGAVAIAAVAVVAFLIAGGGRSYSVRADFQNASQIVKGNLVQVSGRPVGKVTGISLTPDGQAELTMSIDDSYAPLRQGTQATYASGKKR